jgi:AcrR family transcriptional regulator
MMFKMERGSIGLSSQRIEQVSQGGERSKRQERAHRILDAAGELVQRWGYKKTTIDDIAKQAKVAKGTIYLHWKNREDLFIALFLREALDAGDEMLERMESDSEGFLLHNLTKHSIYVSMSRPLIKALYLSDSEMLGELLHSDNEILSRLIQSKLVASSSLFEMLRGKGIVRTDMSIPAQMYTYTAIVVGFMTVDGYLPEQHIISLEEAVEVLAETLRRMFEPDEPILASTLQEIKILLTQFFHQYLAVVKEQLQKEMGL